jgi:hypothetical protein
VQTLSVKADGKDFVLVARCFSLIAANVLALADVPALAFRQLR